MQDDEDRDRQLSLLSTVLARTDLTRPEIVTFTDMRLAISKHGMVLSPGHENWLREVSSRPMVDLAKVEAVELPKPWRPMSKKELALWVLGVVLALVVFQKLLTFVLQWFAWR